MIVKFLLYFLFIICISAIIFVLYSLMPVFLRTKNIFIKKEIFSKEERDIISLKNEALQKNEQIAVVKCNSERKINMRGFAYDDLKDCRVFKNLYESASNCHWGCIGFGTCVSVCPQDAIKIVNNTAVVGATCNGCGKCLNVCPNNLIELVPKSIDFYAACACQNDEMKEICSTACPNRINTETLKPLSAVDVREEDFVCAIKDTNEKTATNDFKFWQKCYNMFCSKHI